MRTYFQNPANGYVEVATTPWTWLWALLFGPFFFAYKGLWGHALLSLFSALVTVGISTFIYPFFAAGLIRRRYGQAGWRKVEGVLAAAVREGAPS